ncbi:hypothetical protein D3C80_1559270 [compost metagenome]
MGVTWGIDVYQVDILSGDQLLPVRYTFRPAQLAGCCRHRLFIAAADDSHLRLKRLRKKHRQTPVCIAVRLAHKLVTDHSNAKLFHLTPP